MNYEKELKKLEELYEKGEYFVLISIGVQFIEFFSDRLIEKDKMVNYLDDNDVLDLIEETGYTVKEWQKLKIEIHKSLTTDNSWKYKILGVLDRSLDEGTNEIKVTPKILTKIRNVHSIRNDLQHKYYTKKINSIKSVAKDCLDICKFLRPLYQSGYLD